MRRIILTAFHTTTREQMDTRQPSAALVESILIIEGAWRVLGFMLEGTAFRAGLNMLGIPKVLI